MPVKKERLLSWLNQSKLQKDNNSLHQTIKGLIDSLEEAQSIISGLSSGGGSVPSSSIDIFPQVMLLSGMGSSQAVSSSTVNDHVVLSDGFEPPAPISDGFGNFIYVAYTP